MQRKPIYTAHFSVTLYKNHTKEQVDFRRFLQYINLYENCERNFVTKIRLGENEGVRKFILITQRQ